MVSGKSSRPTSSRKAIRLITRRSCSSTDPPDRNFAFSYRTEVFDERPGPDPASENRAKGARLDVRMPGLQNLIRGQGRLYFPDALVCGQWPRRTRTTVGLS